MALLAKTWPLFGLQLTTPRLELRFADDTLLAELGNVAAGGVHDPSTMPFSMPWTRVEPPLLQRNALQYFWKLRGELAPTAWELPLAVLRDGEVLGIQSVFATDFPVCRSVSTGSWLGLRHQGQGLGKEMRAAALELAFVGLGAVEVRTNAFTDNASSQGVTRAMGYEQVGWEWRDREGQQVRMDLFRLGRESWQSPYPVSISGLEECLPLLGLA